MGIIQKQAIRSTVFSYLGTVFGFVNVSIFFVRYLSTEEVGLLTFLNSSTKLMAMIFTLGIPLVTQNLFVRYKNEKSNHNGFLTLILLFSILGITLGLLTFGLFNDQIVNGENNNAKYYLYFTEGWIILFTFRLFFMNLDMYLRMNSKTVTGVFLESFLSKLLFFFGLCAYILGFFNFDGIFWLNVFTISLPGFALILYLLYKREKFFVFKHIKRFTVRTKEISSLAAYGIIGGVGATFVMDMDKLMLGNSLNLNAAGVYGVMMLFGMFITLPASNLRRAVTPVLADSWKRNDLENIRKVYKKSALNQLIIGFYIFLGIWFCIDYGMEIVDFPYPYRVCKDVILFVGIAQLIEMITGVNTEIIATSKSYRFNTYFLGILAIIVYLSNLLLIPVLGIEGAAIATVISYFAVNSLRFLFLRFRYQLSPFTLELFKALFIGLLFFLAFSFIPPTSNGFLGILVNGGLITVFYWLTIYALKLSPEINAMLEKVILRRK